MKRLLVFIPALLLAAPAFAQDAPKEAYRDLWCGMAFGTAAQSAPYTDEELAAAKAAGDKATDEQKQIVEEDQMVQQFITGGQGLMDRATGAYKAAGFTDEAFTQVKTDLAPKVTEQISGAGTAAEFTFEECSALLPAAATAPAAGAEAPSAPAATTTTEAPATLAAPETTTTTTTAQ